MIANHVCIMCAEVGTAPSDRGGGSLVIQQGSSKAATEFRPAEALLDRHLFKVKSADIAHIYVNKLS